VTKTNTENCKNCSPKSAYNTKSISHVLATIKWENFWTVSRKFYAQGAATKTPFHWSCITFFAI